jgi:hypothetical protein
VLGVKGLGELGICGGGAAIGNALLERGLQRDRDFENRWPALLGTLLETYGSFVEPEN